MLRRCSGVMWLLSLCLLLAGRVQADLPKADFLFTPQPGKTPQGLVFEGSATTQADGTLLIPTNSRITIPALHNWKLDKEGFSAILTFRSQLPQHLAFFGRTGCLMLRHSAAGGAGVQMHAAGSEGLYQYAQDWNFNYTPGEYVQLAVTAEYMNNEATGQIGYRFCCYVNDELWCERLFYNLEPVAGPADGEFWLGNSGGGFALGGEISDFRFYRRPLPSGDIIDFAKANPRLKAKELALSPELARQLQPQPADEAGTAFLKGILLRAAEGGAAEKKLAATLLHLPRQLQPEEIAAFNRSQKEYRLFATPQIVWALSLNNGTEPALAGALDLRTGRDLSGKRLLGWRLETSRGQLFEGSEGVTSRIEDYQEDAEQAEFTIVWQLPGLVVRSQVTLAGKRLEADLNVDNQDRELRLEQVYYPRFAVIPPSEPPLREVDAGFSGGQSELRLRGSYSFGGDYPSEVSMQFVSVWDARRRGVYLAFEEAEPVCKKKGSGGQDGEYRFDFATRTAYIPGPFGGNGYRSHGPAVLELYEGRWFEAGQIYKRFLQEKSSWYVRELPRQSTPEWYRRNPLWLIGGHPKEVLYLRDYFGFPFGDDRTGFWYELKRNSELPEMIPTTHEPYDLREMMRQFKAAGIRTQGYFNARLWGFCPIMIRDGIPVDRCDRAQGGAILNADGTRHQEDYDDQVLVMCPCSKIWQEVYKRCLQQMVDFGFDGLYMDQTVDAHYLPCYSTEHGHAPNSATYWHEGYFRILRDFRAKMKQENPEIVFLGEGGNDVWNTMMDGYLVWLYGLQDRVPLMQSIYGGGRVQFAARGFESFRGVGSWDAFFCRLGEQFVNSEQLGWFNINDFRYGMGRRRFTKKLALLRMRLAEYFEAADMLAPLEFTPEMPVATKVWGCMVPRDITRDKVVHAVWKRVGDGRIIIPFVNTTTETIRLRPQALPAGVLTICREGRDRPERYADSAVRPDLEIGPQEAQIWFIDRKGQGDDPAVAAVQQVLLEAPQFDDGENMPYPQDFSKCNQLAAASGQWLTAKDASWLALVFREDTPTLGYDPTSSKPEDKANWLLAKAGGIAFFGEVDFGEAGERDIEIELAGLPENAGGAVRLINMTGIEPESVLAETTVPDCGKYFEYKTVRMPLDSRLAGKHKVGWSFEKPVLMRRWRVVSR